MPKELQQKERRPIDDAAKESYSWLGKSYVFIKTTKIKTWQSIFILAFITGSIAALIMSVSLGYHPSSEAAPKEKAPKDGCILSVPGGKFNYATEIEITCGELVRTASFAWDLDEPQNVSKEKGQLKAVTTYPGDKNMWLTVSGTNQTGEFTKTYDFVSPGSCPRVIVDNNIFHLDPCLLHAEMIDGDGNKDFTFTLVRETGTGPYGFSVYGYGVGFPTYAILGGASSGGAFESFTFNKYFNDNVLSTDNGQVKIYSGYLPIKVFTGSQSPSTEKELQLNLAIKVLPKPEPTTPCNDTDAGPNYYEKGETTGYDNYGGNMNNIATYTDKCDSNGRLMEFYCNYQNDPHNGAGYISMDNIDCPHGCFDGACREYSLPKYYFLDLNCEYFYNCYAKNINDEDVVVGDNGNMGFLASPGSIDSHIKMTYEFPEAQYTEVNGLNNRGEAAGSYVLRNESSLQSHGFLYSKGEYISVNKTDARSTKVLAINDSGLMLIEAEEENGFNYYYYDRNVYKLISIPTNYTDGAKVYLKSMNNNGAVIGEYWYGGNRAFIYDGNDFTAIHYPESQHTNVSAINDNGQVVGSYTGQYSGSGSFVYDGNYNNFYYPNNAITNDSVYLTDINNKGYVLGHYRDMGISGEKTKSFVALPVGAVLQNHFPKIAAILNTDQDGIIMNGIHKIGSYRFVFNNEIYEKAQLDELRLVISTEGGIIATSVRAYFSDNPAQKTEPAVFADKAIINLSNLSRSSFADNMAEIKIEAMILNASSINQMLGTSIQNIETDFTYSTKYGKMNPQGLGYYRVNGSTYTN